MSALDVKGMEQIAQPLDDWCEFCETKLATMRSADGHAACAECAELVIKAMQSYEDEQREVEAYVASFVKGPYLENRAMRRQVVRAGKRRNNGMFKGIPRSGSRCR